MSRARARDVRISSCFGTGAGTAGSRLAAAAACQSRHAACFDIQPQHIRSCLIWLRVADSKVRS